MILSRKDIKGCILPWAQTAVLTVLFSNPVWIPYLHAAPQGGTVVGGSGNISQTGSTTTINQTSQNMAIDWQSYNVNTNERVQYIQPNASSISLNRILGGSPSEIRGRIDANGQVILVNPHGVFFTDTAVINVGGIVASALDIQPTDFMNGDFIFNEIPGTEGTVVNSGVINASLGGNVTLLGKQVRNDGLINAKLGSVNLVAGKEAVLTFDNEGLIGVRVTKEILQDEIGIDPAVVNNGQINTEGGRVLLTASTSQDVFSQAVNTSGLDEATSVVVHPDGTFTLGGGADVLNIGSIDVSTRHLDPNDPNVGRIVLLGENVTSSGTLRADATNGHAGEIELHAMDTTLLTGNSVTSARSENNGTGGVVKVLGNHVGLFDQTSVDVSGANGGGTLLVGGGFQGNNARIRNASRTYVSADSQLYADALSQGDGGNIIVWADEVTRFYGNLSARGGEINGDGGFAEVSGKMYLDFQGHVDLTAINGETGTILFDPLNISITDFVITPDNVAANDAFAENATTDVTFTPAQINALLASADLELQANANIEIWDTIGTGTETNTLTLRANDTITINPPGGGADSDPGAINLGSGDIILIAGSNGCNTATPTCAGSGTRNIILNGTLDTTGYIILTAADDIEINNAIGSKKSVGSITLQAGDDIVINSSITSANGATLTGDINLTAGYTDPDNILVASSDSVNLIDILQPINSKGGNITLSATTQITIINSINTTNGTNPAGDFIANTAIFNNNDNNGRIITAFNSSSNVVAGNVTINTTGNVNLGPIITNNTGSGGVSSGGNLTVTTTGGNITQSNNQNRLLNIAGDTKLTTTAANDINLLAFDNSGNWGNRFDGTVSFSGQNVIIYADSGIDLGNAITPSTATGTLFVRSTGNAGPDGDITQSGILDVTGVATFTAIGNDIRLDNIGNAFSTVEFDDTQNLTLADKDGIILAPLTNATITGNISVTVNGTGTITQTGELVVGGDTTLSAGGDITLTDVKNDLNNVNITTANNVNLTDSVNGIGLQGDITTNLIVTATDGDPAGNVITNTGALTVGGTTTITVKGGESIDLSHTGNDFTGDVSFYSGGTINNINLYDNSAFTLQNNITVNGNLTLRGDSLVLGNTVVGGDLVATSSTTGSISQSFLNKVDVTGTTTLTAGSGGIDMLGSNNFNQPVSITTSSGGNVSLLDTNSFTFGASNISGNLDLYLGGNLDQVNNAGPDGVTVNGTANITLPAGSTVTLNNPDNQFSTVKIGAPGNGKLLDVTLFNDTSIVIQGLNITGDLTLDVSNANITDSVNIIVAGTTTLGSGTGSITLDNDNDFNDLLVTSGNVSVTDINSINLTGSSNANSLSLSVVDSINEFGSHNINTLSMVAGSNATVNLTGNVDLGTSSIGGNLTINSVGDITNTAGGLNVTGTATFNAAENGDVILDHANNAFNGELAFSNDLDRIQINNTTATQLTSITNTNDLIITSTGDITSTGPVTVNNTTTLNSGTSNITLTNPANDFNELNITTANIARLHDSNDIALGTINANQFYLTTGGAITDNNGSNTNINANLINLNAQTGMDIDTQVNEIIAVSNGRDINIANSGAVLITRLKNNGNITLNNDADVTIDQIDAGYNTGTLRLNVTDDGSVFGVARDHKSQPDITAYNAIITVADTFGENRPISVDVNKEFLLFARVSNVYYWGDGPDTITDNSDIQLHVINALIGLGGQLIEVETLAELDPAIFTEVRNYYHDEVAINLPSSQRFTEKDDEEDERRMIRAQQVEPKKQTSKP